MVATLSGLTGPIDNIQKIQIELETLKGFPDFNILGLNSRSSNDLKHKLKSIVTNSGFKYPALKKVATFLPSSKEKYGFHYDLPISLCYLKSTNQLRYNFKKTDLFLGELSLDGSSNPIQHILPIINSAKTLGFKNIFIPKQNYIHTYDISGINIIAYSSLSDLVNKLKSFDYPVSKKEVAYNDSVNFDTIEDNLYAKRILSICVGSFANVLLVGFPGIGKSLLVKSIKSILPPPTNFFQKHQIDNYPINICDSTLTKSDLVGSKHKLGLFQESHLGILAVNELPDLSKKTFDLLKGPIEEKEYIIGNSSIPFMASFIATMNPCKCGYLNSKKHNCKCNPYNQSNYINKVSIPFLDRFDAFVDLTNDNNPTIKVSSKKTQTQKAKDIISQLRQYQSDNNMYISEMDLALLKSYSTEKASLLMSFLSQKLNLSIRRQIKMLRLAFSISLSDKKETISAKHIYEALSYQNYLFKSVLPKKQ